MIKLFLSSDLIKILEPNVNNFFLKRYKCVSRDLLSTVVFNFKTSNLILFLLTNLFKKSSLIIWASGSVK